MKKWDEKLADLSTDLAKLSQKAADASEDAKTAREMRQEAINDRISTAKGNVVAFQEKVRIASDERKGKISSALLKAQMTMEERIRQRKEKKNRKLFEAYIDDQISYISENFETASYLISSAQLAILETIEAIDEYNAKYGEAGEELSDGTDEGATEAEASEEAEDAAEEESPAAEEVAAEEETPEAAEEEAEETAVEETAEEAEEAAE